MRPLLLALPALALTLSGCAFDTTVGCDFREGSLNGPESRCQERGGTQGAGFDAACEASGGVAIDGGCDLTDAVAGCRTDIAGGYVTDWYYAPETVETVTATCADDDAELVNP